MYMLNLIVDEGVDNKSEIEAYAESMGEIAKFYHYFGSAVDYATGGKYILVNSNTVCFNSSIRIMF